MALPISTAKATKGTMMNNYGKKKKAGAKTAAKKGKKGLPPALAKRAAEMKAKAKKSPKKGSGRR